MHQRKMGKIATGNKAIKEAKEISNMLKKNREDRKKTKEFLTNEKNITINKDNQILLNKLVEISSGKWSSVAPAPLKKAPVQRTKSVKNGPTSLNMGVRKRETERIEKENHAFAKRLFDKQAVLSKKNLDNDWANHIKHKKLIQKLGPGAPSIMGFKNGKQRFAGMGGVYSSANMGKSGQSLNEMTPMEQQQYLAQQEQYNQQMQ